MGPYDQSAIATALRFTPDELALNRAGRVSDRQRDVLGRARKRGRAFLLFVLLVMVAFVVVVVVVIVPKVKDAKGDGSTPVVPIVGGAIGFVVVVMFLSLLRSRRSLDRLASGVVLAVTGPAKTRVHRMPGNVGDLQGGTAGTDGGVRYELTIGKTMFFVPGRVVLDAFQDGAAYRGYYATGRTRGSNALLSAEPV
jgi:predicted nucleic acid-binding Zn ribbon protein